MKLLNEIVNERNTYSDRLQQIAEQVDIWLESISKEKRLGLKPMEQIVAEADPYNAMGKGATPTQAAPNDTVDFTPSQDKVEQPVQPPSEQNGQPMRVHLIYDPKTGEIVKTMKTSMRSRPPAEYMEATAEQISGALKHIEKLNPRLADLLVKGRVNVWIPRASMQASPTNTKHLGLSSQGNNNKLTLSPDQLAAARGAADKMSIAK